MIVTLILIMVFSLSSAASDEYENEQEKITDSKATSYYIYDDQAESFNQIPKSEASVDSLLELGDEKRDRDSSLSFRVARQAVTIAAEIDYKEGLAGAYNLMGMKYLDFGDHELAHEHYLKSMRLEEELGNREGIASLFNNISLIYAKQEDYETAAKYLEASIDTWKEINSEQETLFATNNLGVIYRRSGQFEKALDLFWKASRQAVEQDEPDSLVYSIATLNIGNTYRNLGKLNRAKIHLNTALDYFVNKGLTSQTIYTHLVLGKLYREQQQTELALQYAENVLALATEQQMRDMVKDAHQLLAEIHELDQNYKIANEHLRLYFQHSDTLQNMQRGEKIENLQARYETEQKERKIDILNKEAELREANLTQMNQLRSFLIASVVFLFMIIALLYRENLNRKQNNKELEQKQKEIEDKNVRLQALNEEKDEFMSIAAHDLRNPLSSINMAVDLINDEENLDKSVLAEYTELIKISANRMISLINNVLQIHTIDASSNAAASKEIHINDLVNESLQHFDKPSKSKNIRLTTVLKEKIPPVVGDSDNLLRIFDNLISNAIKYSPKNSTVIISTRQVEDKIQITVRDQGRGIQPEDKKKLFGKFSRLSNKPTGNESSTGLGLYIVKKICKTMGGEVRCESEPGCGATFIVELPAQKTALPTKFSASGFRNKKKVAG